MMEDVKTINVFLENEKVAIRFVKTEELADLVIREDASVRPVFKKENPIENVTVFKSESDLKKNEVNDEDVNYLLKEKGIIPDDIEIQISNLLKGIGFPAHIKGYPYAREAILLILNDDNILNKVTKELYPQIADKYNTTASRVERAIRHSIEVAFKRGNPDTISKIFANFSGKRPSNSEFLAGVFEYLRIRNKL